MSKPKINKAPEVKPTAAGITLTKPDPGLISIPGARRLQKLAATITPPVKPSIPSKTARFIVLNKKTNAAPTAVNPQVNRVAYKAPFTGDIFSKKEIIDSNIATNILYSSLIMMQITTVNAHIFVGLTK